MVPVGAVIARAVLHEQTASPAYGQDAVLLGRVTFTEWA
jgi:hypothetical protein